jgi:two-component system, NtrC family, sensor kinase
MDENISFSENGQTDDMAKTLEGHYERIETAETVRKALLARHHFSLRLQIYLGFFLVFLFAVGIAAALLLTTHQVEEKLRTLEIVNDFVIEIQQARRFEKNFFLYGTNLSDALENVYKARDIFDRNAAELRPILAKNGKGTVPPDIDLYESLLKRLVELDQNTDTNQKHSKNVKEIELELRQHGQKMVSFAQNLMDSEREAVSRALIRSRTIHVYSLIFLLIFIIINAYFLGSRILGNINRFTVYARRIASGDFTPITPTRAFRDEFTDLAVTINQMIQELESREAVLIQSHKMRAVGTLTAGIAHELNNPLNNITLTAHMLLEDYQSLSDDERKEMAEDIVGEAKRSKHIISNLLDFARESGSQLEPLDLSQLLSDTINLSANQIKISGIRIEFQATDNLPRIHGDSQQLRQVFLNLILNAIDASKKGDRIQVMVLPADDPNYVAVKVIDSGSGIPDHILGSIFDPFFSTKGKGKGTGLGRSVSQGIVGKHGGLIRVTSREGKGSTFSVTLPVTTIPAELFPKQKLLENP